MCSGLRRDCYVTNISDVILCNHGHHQIVVKVILEMLEAENCSEADVTVTCAVNFTDSVSFS